MKGPDAEFRQALAAFEGFAALWDARRYCETKLVKSGHGILAARIYMPGEFDEGAFLGPVFLAFITREELIEWKRRAAELVRNANAEAGSEDALDLVEAMERTRPAEIWNEARDVAIETAC